MSCAVRVSAYAKINLSLHVVGVRPDGYHELRTIFQSIALHDTLTVRLRPGPFALRCDDPDCPADDTNLVWRAAEQAWAASGRRGALRDVDIRLAKRIPVRAGLGGGSSDAAAALRALAALWRLKGAPVREIAATLGADVPYFLEGGTALGLDRGDLLYPLVDHPAAWVTLVVPAFGVSTVEAYRWWDDDAGRTLSGRASGRSTGAGRTLLEPRAAGPALLCPASELRNDLQDPVAARHPEISRIVSALRKAGAFHAAMSGSGSAVFGLFTRRPDAVRAARAISKSRRALGGPEGKGPRNVLMTLVTKTVNRAAYQRLAGIPAHRINLPFAPRSLGHS
jgi:4-diphosphocytidyl-2-C-methyl-D-erythritol kinase